MKIKTTLVVFAAIFAIASFNPPFAEAQVERLFPVTMHVDEELQRPDTNGKRLNDRRVVRAGVELYNLCVRLETPFMPENPVPGLVPPKRQRKGLVSVVFRIDQDFDGSFDGINDLVVEPDTRRIHGGFTEFCKTKDMDIAAGTDVEVSVKLRKGKKFRRDPDLFLSYRLFSVIDGPVIEVESYPAPGDFTDAWKNFRVSVVYDSRGLEGFDPVIRGSIFNGEGRTVGIGGGHRTEDGRVRFTVEMGCDEVGPMTGFKVDIDEFFSVGYYATTGVVALGKGYNCLGF